MHILLNKELEDNEVYPNISDIDYYWCTDCHQGNNDLSVFKTHECNACSRDHISFRCPNPNCEHLSIIEYQYELLVDTWTILDTSKLDTYRQTRSIYAYIPDDITEEFCQGKYLYIASLGYIYRAMNTDSMIFKIDKNSDLTEMLELIPEIDLVNYDPDKLERLNIQLNTSDNNLPREMNEIMFNSYKKDVWENGIENYVPVSDNSLYLPINSYNLYKPKNNTELFPALFNYDMIGVYDNGTYIEVEMDEYDHGIIYYHDC